MPLPENFGNTTDMEDVHPDAHNAANALVNNLQALLAIARTDIDSVQDQLGGDPGGVYVDVTQRSAWPISPAPSMASGS